MQNLLKDQGNVDADLRFQRFRELRPDEAGLLRHDWHSFARAISC
jgi:hypothetical protein